ncbi:histidine kinase [Streptomyces sp. NPDC048254]|uniref:histidine kinase n=1 Tax=Streptomyces sp. NPDC048254 TaxID=3365525 RepID=UPI003710E2A2
MLLHAAERDLTDRPDVARARMRAAVEGLDAGLSETRRIIHDLTPTTVAESGLEGSLRLLCERAQQQGTAERVQFRSVNPPPGTGRARRHHAVPSGAEHAGERTGARTGHEPAGHPSPSPGPH